MAARKNFQATRKSTPPPSAEPEKSEDSFESFADIDLSTDPDAPAVAPTPAPVVPDDKPVRAVAQGARPKWRLLANVKLDCSDSVTKAGSVVDLTEDEAAHLRKQGACEPA